MFANSKVNNKVKYRHERNKYKSNSEIALNLPFDLRVCNL